MRGGDIGLDGWANRKCNDVARGRGVESTVDQGRYLYSFTVRRRESVISLSAHCAMKGTHTTQCLYSVHMV